MNNQGTLEKMSQMRLHGMVRAFRDTMETGVKHQFTADEMIAHLIDAEWDDRHNRKLKRLIKGAHFRYQATIEEIDFTLSRNLDKNFILRLTNCSWLEKKENIIFTGPTGVGKSFISSALAYQGCIYGYKVGYYASSRLFSHLKLSEADGSHLKELEKLSKLDLLVIDDFGLEILDNSKRLSLLEIIEDRHGKKSTIFVSQLPITKWHEVIGDATIADAICDRIIHSAHQIKLKGESVRKTYKKRSPRGEDIDE